MAKMEIGFCHQIDFEMNFSNKQLEQEQFGSFVERKKGDRDFQEIWGSPEETRSSSKAVGNLEEISSKLIMKYA